MTLKSFPLRPGVNENHEIAIGTLNNITAHLRKPINKRYIKHPINRPSKWTLKSPI